MAVHFGRIVFGFLIILYGLTSRAQMFYFRDSLEVLQLEKKLNSITGKTRIDIQNQIAAKTVHFNPDKAFEISRKMGYIN